ncbi:MAG: hypothetical protein NVS4B3_18380 [Gemmatimonadaceae bacterium]
MTPTGDPIARARERYAARDYHGVVLILQEATLEGQAYADAYNLLGISLAMMDRRAEALTAFDRALSINPRYVEALVNRSVLLSALGRPHEAQAGFEAAERLARPDASGFSAIAANRLANGHAALAAEYREAGALDDAIAQYRRALELRPGYADVRLALARAFIERGLYADAATAADGALAVRPDWPDAMLLRGLAAYLAGDLDAAAAIWARAGEQSADEPRLQVYRAMLARRRATGS